MRTNGSFLAITARDNKGKVLKIHTFKLRVSIPQVAELEAVAKAMLVAHTHGWPKVIFEIDAITIFNVLHRKDKSSLHWASESLFTDILLRSSNAQVVNFNWAPRTTNRLAHNVGKWAATH